MEFSAKWVVSICLGIRKSAVIEWFKLECNRPKIWATVWHGTTVVSAFKQNNAGGVFYGARYIRRINRTSYEISTYISTVDFPKVYGLVRFVSRKCDGMAYTVGHTLI